MVNPTGLVCMYLIKFVEVAITMPRGVHLNKSRLDRKSDGHTFGIVVPSHRLGMPLLQWFSRVRVDDAPQVVVGGGGADV